MGFNCHLRPYLIRIDSPAAAGLFKLASSAATSPLTLTLTLRGHDWRFALPGLCGGFQYLSKNPITSLILTLTISYGLTILYLPTPI